MASNRKGRSVSTEGLFFCLYSSRVCAPEYCNSAFNASLPGNKLCFNKSSRLNIWAGK